MCVGSSTHQVFKKAGYSIFITTLTTAVAFLGNCVSRVSAIRSFGLFLGLLVSVNYCLVMTVYASSLVLFDSSAKTGLPCLPKIGVHTGFTAKACARTYSEGLYRLKWPVLVLFVSGIAGAFSLATKIEPDEELIRAMPPESNQMMNKRINREHIANGPMYSHGSANVIMLSEFLALAPLPIAKGYAGGDDDADSLYRRWLLCTAGTLCLLASALVSSLQANTLIQLHHPYNS
jgi:hypothetical protein